MASPRTQNPVQYWQLRSRLTVQQAADRIGITLDRYLTVVLSGESRFTEAEIQRVLSATGIAEDGLRAWEQRPKGDTRNLPAWQGPTLKVERNGQQRRTTKIPQGEDPTSGSSPILK
jgi:hypothetical protein